MPMPFVVCCSGWGCWPAVRNNVMIVATEAAPPSAAPNGNFRLRPSSSGWLTRPPSPTRRIPRGLSLEVLRRYPLRERFALVRTIGLRCPASRHQQEHGDEQAADRHDHDQFRHVRDGESGDEQQDAEHELEYG